MINKSKKALLAVAVLAAMVVTPALGTTNQAFAEGMAYRERQDQGEQQQEGMAYRERQDQGEQQQEGMAYRERQDQGEQQQEGMAYRERQDQGIPEGQEGMAYRERQDQGEQEQEGMAYRERQSDWDRDYATKTWKNMNNEERRIYVERMEQTSDGRAELDKEYSGQNPFGYGIGSRAEREGKRILREAAKNTDPNGMNAFNKTHGR